MHKLLHSELIAAEKAKMDEESKSAIGDRIKPLPSTEGMDDEQLRQLARELHAAIDKVLRHMTTQRSMDQSVSFET